MWSHLLYTGMYLHSCITWFHSPVLFFCRSKIIHYVQRIYLCETPVLPGTRVTIV